MNWEDEGFVISKRKFRENAIILEIFTNKYGKVSGLVYGGTSRKIKNYLQLINKIFVVFNSKGENRPGYFKTELISAISPNFFNDKNKMLCINSLSSILKIVLPENQPYKKIYHSLDKLLLNFKSISWIIQYLQWELELINDMGFGFNINRKEYSNLNNKKFITIKLDNIEYKVPSFLFSKNYKNIDNKDIHMALLFLRNLMENKFFIPNSIRFPQSRKLLEKKFF